MLKWRRSGWAAMLGAALLVLGSGGANVAHGFQVNTTVDENGHGTLTNTDGFMAALPFALQPDPGPGGLPSALTYSLLSPPGLTAGDVLISEPGDGLGDVVRFNPGETCVDGTVGCLVFYSAGPPLDSLADTLTPPGAFYANNITLFEDATGQVIYTPVAGEPGFVAGAGGPVVYDLISDPVPVPAPLIGHGLPGVLAVGGVLLLGAKLLERGKKRHAAA